MNPRIIPLALIAMLTASAHCSEVKLRLHRQETAGNVAGIDVQVSSESTRTASQPGSNSETQSESETIRFKARREILKVDGTGLPTLITYTVRELAITGSNAGSYPVLRPGQVLITELANGTTRFIVDGVEQADVAPFSRLAFLNLNAGGGITHDEFFGTNRGHQTGKEWRVEMNPETVAKLGLPAAGTGSHAVGLINRMEKINGIDCAVFTKTFHLNTGEANLKTLEINPEGLPRGTKVKTGLLTITGTGLFPVDSSLPELGGCYKVEMVTKIEIPQVKGAPVAVDWKVESIRTVSLTFEPNTVLMEPTPVEPTPSAKPSVGMVGLYRRAFPAPTGNQTELQPSPPPAPTHSIDQDRTSHIHGYLGSMGIDE
jgi:hypothetical protein